MFRLKESASVGKELRKVVMETLANVMDTQDEVVFFEADLAGASGSSLIQKRHPERYVQCGISEANMVGMAAGISTLGFVPFIHSFGPFATRRVLDQLYLSGAYAKTTVNIYGSDPGYCVGHNGGTHTTYEDVASLRSIPTVTILDVADQAQMESLLPQLAKKPGVNYFRANRKGVKDVYELGSTFEIGKGVCLCEGNDVLLVASGHMVAEALEASQSLSKEGIHCTVLDMFSIKPFDTELLLKHAQGKKLVVTSENHYIKGGLGSTVAETLLENEVFVKLVRHGVDERFGQVGTPTFLQEEYGLTASRIVELVKENL